LVWANSPCAAAPPIRAITSTVKNPLTGPMAWVELLVVVGCFGFPQSFVYVIHRLGASARRLALLSAAYSLAFLPLAWGMTLAALALGGARLGGDSLAQLALALSAALFVLHGLWRGVFLTTGREMWFAAFSILPPVSLFGSVLAGMASGHGHFAALFVLSAAASVAVALVLMRPVLRPLQPEASGAGSVPWKALLANGAHAFVQALLLVVQPLLAYGLIRSQGGGNPQIGLFNVGVFLVQGLSVPITMVSPLLFAHWTSTDDASRMARLHAATPRGLAAGMALGLLLAAASLWGVPLLFGASYAAAAPLAAVMMLALPLTCHGRLISPALHAHDRPMANSVAGVLRLASLAFAACGLMAAGADVLMAVAVGWSFSEVVASGWVLWLLRRFVREQRQRQVAGGD
jgi:hypothetical protein